MVILHFSETVFQSSCALIFLSILFYSNSYCISRKGNLIDKLQLYFTTCRVYCAVGEKIEKSTPNFSRALILNFPLRDGHREVS